MPKFRINYLATASTSITVEAEDEAEAFDLADRADLSGICAQCSGWGRTYSLDLGEWGPDEEYPIEAVDA